MILGDLWQLFEREVFPVRPPEGLFNPYAQQKAGADRAGAARIRQRNLRLYCESFPARPEILIVGEAPGPRGCRFSGVPFTSEAQFATGELPFGGTPSSSDGPHSETSAAVFWKVLGAAHPRFFVWNALPFYPHRPDDFSALRSPRGAEIEHYAPLLGSIIACVRPGRILAVGRVAERAVFHTGYTPLYVRHPSHGGAARFADGMAQIFSLRSVQSEG